ncbi:MAG TPA: DinB family protein, partial [Nocardioides sp.]|nr:DinB family protein [Nocardioides sp.]
AFRAVWAQAQERWSETIERGQALPEELLHQRVGGEWSLVQTLRHLLFVTDSWVRRGVLGERAPWHHLDLPPTGMTRVRGLADADVAASFGEVLGLRAERTAVVGGVLATLTDAELDEERRCVGPGHPKAGLWSVRRCLEAQINEEWRHRDYAERDLAKLTG